MIDIIRTFRTKRWTNIFVIYLRYLIGGAFVFSAVPKISGERFMTLSGEDAPIDTFPHFFETLYQSGFYWEFLGWGQLLAALLLMTQLFATLGTLAFFPIILNIFMITISYEFGGTPVVTGVMLLANIFLLTWDAEKLLALFLPEQNHEQVLANRYNEFANHKFWAWLGLLLFATTFIYVVIFGRNPMNWFLICMIEGLVGFIFMIIKYPKNKNTTFQHNIKKIGE